MSRAGARLKGMEYFTTDLEGLTLLNPTEAQLRAVLQSVMDDPEADYPEVYLTTAAGEVMGFGAHGLLFQEEDGEIVRVIRGVGLEDALHAWQALAGGQLETLEALPWKRVDA